MSRTHTTNATSCRALRWKSSSREGAPHGLSSGTENVRSRIDQLTYCTCTNSMYLQARNSEPFRKSNFDSHFADFGLTTR